MQFYRKHKTTDSEEGVGVGWRVCACIPVWEELEDITNPGTET